MRSSPPSSSRALSAPSPEIVSLPGGAPHVLDEADLVEALPECVVGAEVHRDRGRPAGRVEEVRGVVPEAADVGVVAGAAHEHVDRVVVVPSSSPRRDPARRQTDRSRCCREEVVALEAPEDVVAPQPGDDVVARGAGEHVVVGGADDRGGATGASVAAWPVGRSRTAPAAATRRR